MIRHSNDQFFKAAFGRVEVAKAFLKSRLKKAIIATIKLNTLTPQKSSFVSKELQARYSDVVYRVDTETGPGYVYFLLEQQSRIDKRMPLRIMEYMVAIMRHDVNQQHKKGAKLLEIKLPVIFPFVIYTGQKGYNSTKRLIDAFDTPHLLYKMLESNYVVELQSESIRDIMKDNEAGLAEVMLRESIKRDFCPLLDNNPEINKLIHKSHYKDEIIMYILAREPHSVTTVLDKIEDLDEKDKTKIMSALRRIEQRGIKLGEQRGIKLGEQRGIKLGEQRGIKLGEQRGVKLGEQRGKQQGLREAIIKLLASGMNKPQVASILEITLKKLESLLG